jgi:hypothetical protein
MSRRENNDYKFVTEPTVVKSRANSWVGRYECRNWGGPVPGSTRHLRRFLWHLTPLFFQPQETREYHTVLVETSCKFWYRSPCPPLHWSPTKPPVLANGHDGTWCLAKTGKELCELSCITVNSTVFEVTREGKREPEFVEVPLGRTFCIFQGRWLMWTNLGTKTEMKAPENLSLCHCPIRTIV